MIELLPKPNLWKGYWIESYEARVHFGTRVRVRVRVRDSVIFEKGGCGYGRTQRLKNY